MQLIHGLHFRNLRGDIYGGLVAAVVALPLALAFGVASGAGVLCRLIRWDSSPSFRPNRSHDGRDGRDHHTVRR